MIQRAIIQIIVQHAMTCVAEPCAGDHFIAHVSFATFASAFENSSRHEVMSLQRRYVYFA